jgi:pimeloyl-ACP methyl ester carboxylesterase
LLRLAPQGDGHAVLVLPGLMASDASTIALRNYLKRQGFDAHGWGLGRNKGFRPHLETQLIAKMRRMAEESGRKISLVGWSLGGIYARQLAKDRPDLVRQVISLGSPFGGPPKATNAWRVYELASRSSVDDIHVPHFAQDLVAPPPVPTTAIMSRTDGVCSWQNCMEQDAELAENIEVYGSHCGLGHHPAAMYAIADRLSQPEGAWKKFAPHPMVTLAFPNPYRGMAA